MEKPGSSKSESRNTSSAEAREIERLLSGLLNAEAGDPLDLPAIVTTLSSIRGNFPALNGQIDGMLVTAFEQSRKQRFLLRKELEKVCEAVKKLDAEPLHSARFLAMVRTEAGMRALVAYGTQKSALETDADLDPAELRSGDAVFLNPGRNLVLSQAPALFDGGETATFKCATENGKILLKKGEDEIEASVSAGLEEQSLEAGDLVRFDPSGPIALGKIPMPKGEHHCLLREVPDISPEQIGGQDDNLRRILFALTVALMDPGKAARYGITGRQTILLIGPPGTGKTLMAQAAASTLAKTTGCKCHFAVVKPAEFEDPFVGVTERKIREFFHAMREAAKEGHVVVFFDEIESIGRTRGARESRHSDAALAALLAELDGFESRENVAIISASNRKDLIDASLLERISDMEIEVARPRMDGAEAILKIHLPADFPFSPNGSEAARSRGEVIQAGVSLLFAPNADNEVCVIKFADGKSRTVTARDLISGRVLAQIAKQACRTALERDLSSGADGITIEDMRDAVADAIARMRTTLTIHNAHSMLGDLPQDLAVVGVTPAGSARARSARLLNAR